MTFNDDIIKDRDDWRRAVEFIAAALGSKTLCATPLAKQISLFRSVADAAGEFLSQTGACNFATGRAHKYQCALGRCAYCNLSRAHTALIDATEGK